MMLQLQVQVTGNAQGQLNAVATATSNIGNAARGANNSLRGIITTIRDIRTVLAVLESAKIFSKLVMEGIQFNALLQTSRLGLAALIATFTIMEDATGRQLSTFERYAHAQKIAVDLQTRMKIAALETTLQYSDLLDVMQRGMPFMMQHFHDTQGNVASNQKLVNFITSFSQGGMAFGLSPEELGTNVQRLLTGSADARHARYAYAILQSINGGGQNAKNQIAEWEKQGVLVDKLMEKIAAFGRLGQDAMGTFSGALSNFKDAAQQALGEATQDATKELTSLLLELKDGIVSVGVDGKMYFNPDFVDTVKNLASAFVTLAKALAGVAEVLATIGAHLGNPNIQSLLAAFGGAVAGGMVGGPWGAAVGGLAMYFSATNQQDIEKERRAAAEQAVRWRKNGGNELGGLVPGPGGHGQGMVAGAYWPGGTDQLNTTVGQLKEQMTPDQFSMFKTSLVSRAQTHHYNTGSANDYWQRDISYQDFILARKEGYAYDADKIKVKSPPVVEDPDKIRRAQLALEKYREAIQHIQDQLAKNVMKDSLASVMDSFDAAIAQAKEDSKYQIFNVHSGKIEERTDNSAVINLEREKADVKALNEYYADLARIKQMEQDLDNKKAQADLSKTRPEDLQMEAEARKQIADAKLTAEKQYHDDLAKNKKIADTKSAHESKEIYARVDKETVEEVQKHWEEFFQNRKQWEEELAQWTAERYQGITEGLSAGLKGIVSSFMSGGKNPFGAFVDSFKNLVANSLGGFLDQKLHQFSIITSGESKPYTYTKDGAPVYAGSALTNQYRMYANMAQGAVSAYSLYQAGQAGMTKRQGAASGAMMGLQYGLSTGNPIIAIAATIIGAALGALAGKAKVGYNVSVSGGKIKVTGEGSANSGDVSAAVSQINKDIEDTSNSLYNVLFGMPAAVLQALSAFKPGDLKKTGTRWFDNNSLKLFLQQDVPKMVLESFVPALQSGFEAMGVAKAKLKEIFSRVDDPGFDPKDFIQKLNDYGQILVGLQDVMKFMSTVADDGSGWDAKQELANKKLNPSPVQQITDIDSKIAGITGLFGSMTWDEQLSAGKQLLQLAQQRVQIEMQALVALRNAWLSIESSINSSKDQINYQTFFTTPEQQKNYWGYKAINGQYDLLNMLDHPDDYTADDVTKKVDEINNAAMNMFNVMKQRYDDEMQLIRQIDDAIKSVQKSTDDFLFEIQFDQARLGTDASGNPIYDKKMQGDMLLGRQRDLFDQLKTAQTQDDVLRIRGEIEQNARTLYDLWGRTPEAARQVEQMMIDAGHTANDSLVRLRQAAEEEAQKYKNAADDALAILTGTADIANAVLNKMKEKIEQLDPNAYANLDQILGDLSGTMDTASTITDNFGRSIDTARTKVDDFGNTLFSWSQRLQTKNTDNAGHGSNPANAATANMAPVIILNGSMAAVAEEVEVRIGNKIYTRTLNTVNRRMAGSAF
jgi:hypothetical protein